MAKQPRTNNGYTPGPWVISGKSSMEEHTIVVAAKDPSVRKGAIGYIFEHPDFEGDMLLIQHAPDMFAALKSLVGVGEQLSLEKIQRARNIIAKIEAPTYS